MGDFFKFLWPSQNIWTLPFEWGWGFWRWYLGKLRMSFFKWKNVNLKGKWIVKVIVDTKSSRMDKDCPIEWTIEVIILEKSWKGIENHGSKVQIDILFAFFLWINIGGTKSLRVFFLNCCFFHGIVCWGNLGNDLLMSESCHFDRGSKNRLSVEFWIFVMVLVF